MTWATLIATIATPLFVILGLVLGAGRWMGKVDANTAATQELTEAFKNHAEKVDNTVTDHEVRIRLLESSRIQTSPIPVLPLPVVSPVVP